MRVKNQDADAFSVLETTGADERNLEDEIPVLYLEATRQETCCVCETCDGLSAENRRIPLVLDIEGSETILTPTTEYSIKRRAEDNFFKQKAQTVKNPESAYKYEKDGFIVRRAHIGG